MFKLKACTLASGAVNNFKAVYHIKTLISLFDFSLNLFRHLWQHSLGYFSAHHLKESKLFEPIPDVLRLQDVTAPLLKCCLTDD
jgi:hypothetical protein